ncbi:MAG: hypothetical protein ACYTF7_05855 [Planctomycetota bacterium]|jgi:hypothetical protein
MRDDWIFKLAIIAGLLAFSWRLLTFPTPNNQQQFTSPPETRIGREANRAERNGRHVDAAVLFTALQKDQYNNHNGWHRISDALAIDENPLAAMGRWRSLATGSPQSIIDENGEPILDDDHVGWLREFFDDTGGEAFVAYYLGVKLIDKDNVNLSTTSFKNAFDGFSALVHENPQNATLWDRLYVARSAMRLQLTGRCADALLDLERFMASEISEDDRNRNSGIVRAIGRTWMNNDNMQEGLRVWKSLSEDRLRSADPLNVIREWANYVRGTNPDQEPEIRYAVALTIWDTIEQIHPDDPLAQTPEFLDTLEFFVYRARNVGASDIETEAGTRLYNTFTRITSADDSLDVLSRKARYEAIAGNAEPMYSTLRELQEHPDLDHIDFYRMLDSRPAFNPYRDDERFQQILARTAEAAEGKNTRSLTVN